MAIHKRTDGSDVDAQAKQQLKAALQGQLIIKGEIPDEEYRPYVMRWNEAYMSDASFIALVESEADVTTCLKFVDEHYIDLAVAGGRHSYYGASSSEGFVIDLRRLNNVTVDKASLRVKAGGGCLAADVEGASEKEGVMVGFGAISETGIGGITTGGGVGWLTGQNGLVADNVMSARVALANGDIVNASANENPDLYWGIRGGGPNFGICLEFEYKAYPQGPVFFTLLAFTPDKLEAIFDALEPLRQNAVEPSNGKLCLNIVLKSPSEIPDAPPMPAVMIFYNGLEDEAKKLVSPLYDLGPVHEQGGACPYTAVTNIYDKFRMNGFDRWASSTVHVDYPINKDIVLHAMNMFTDSLTRYGDKFKPSMVMLDARDYRKVASVPRDATIYSHRYNAAMLSFDYRWDDPALDGVARKEAKNITNWIKEEMKRQRQSGKISVNGGRNLEAVYPNVGGKDEKLESVYAENLPRAREVKRRYDPGMLFDKWYPITPI